MNILDYLSDVPVAAISGIVSGIVGFCIGRALQRRNESTLRLNETEERIWKFAKSAEEYWNLQPGGEEVLACEITMRHLSVRIGVDIDRLRSYPYFQFDRDSSLTALRRAAMSEPFEKIGRQPEPRRGDLIRQKAEQLVRELSSSPQNFWKNLLRRLVHR